MKRIRPTEGLSITFLPSEKLKTNYLSVCFVVPLDEKTASLNALVPKILMRGCRKYPSMTQLNEKLENLYASALYPVYAKRAGTLITGFAVDFIKQRFLPDGTDLETEALGVVRDILCDPLTENGAFRADYTESEKKDLLNIIASLINNKASYAKEKCSALLLEGLAAGLPEYGTEDAVKAATPASVFEQYRTLLSSCPVEVFAYGEFDERKLTDFFAELFGSSRGSVAAFPPRSFLSGVREDVRTVTEPMPVAQGKLVMGFSIGDVSIHTDNAAAFLLFNEIFGGSPSSKLFMNVREAMSLCYYCRSIPDLFAGTLFVSSGIETENFDKARSAILRELDAVKAGDFSLKDLDDAKRSCINTYREIDDTPGTLCLWLTSRRIFGSDITPEALIEAFRSVTKEEVIAAGKDVVLQTVYFIEGTGSEEGFEE